MPVGKKTVAAATPTVTSGTSNPTDSRLRGSSAITGPSTDDDGSGGARIPAGGSLPFPAPFAGAEGGDPRDATKLHAATAATRLLSSRAPSDSGVASAAARARASAPRLPDTTDHLATTSTTSY